MRLRVLEELLRRRCPRLARLLEEADVSSVIYASPWLLSMYAAEFPTTFTCRILDVALAERSSAVVMRVALAILEAAEEALVAIGNDFEGLVVHLKMEPKAWPHAKQREVLSAAFAMGDVGS